MNSRQDPGAGAHLLKSTSTPVKSHYYSQHAVALRAELGYAVSRDLMRDLHRKVAWRHFLVAARQFAILTGATWGLIHFQNPLIWIPLALLQGLTIFDFTILLHEVVHHTVFERRRPIAERILGLLLCDSQWNLREPIHTLAPRSSRRARVRRGRSQTPPSVAEGQQAVV